MTDQTEGEPEVLDVRVRPADQQIDGPRGDATDGGDELARKMAEEHGWGQEAAQ